MRLRAGRPRPGRRRGTHLSCLAWSALPAIVIVVTDSQEATMWPFSNKAVTRQMIKAAFGSYIDDETIGQIFEGKKGWPPPRIMHKEFIIMLARDDDHNDVGIESEISAVIDVFLANDGILESIIYPLYFITFFSFEQERKKIEQIVKSIPDRNKHNIKILYGEGEFRYSTFVAGRTIRYVPAMSQFSRALSLLVSMDFGTTNKWPLKQIGDSALY